MVDDGGVVPGAGPVQVARAVDFQKGHGHEALVAGLGGQHAVDLAHQGGGSGNAVAVGPQRGAGGGHQQGGGDPVTADVTHGDEHPPRQAWREVDQVIIVAAGGVAVLAAPGDVQAVMGRVARGQQALLHHLGQGHGVGQLQAILEAGGHLAEIGGKPLHFPGRAQVEARVEVPAANLVDERPNPVDRLGDQPGDQQPQPNGQKRGDGREEDRLVSGPPGFGQERRLRQRCDDPPSYPGVGSQGGNLDSYGLSVHDGAQQGLTRRGRTGIRGGDLAGRTPAVARTTGLSDVAGVSCLPSGETTEPLDAATSRPWSSMMKTRPGAGTGLSRRKLLSL